LDNVTHTLISVLVGESAARATANVRSGLPGATRRNLMVSLMAVGGNLPDLDFLYSAVTGDKLDYLLHHRGHTHTVIGALAAAALLLIATDIWLRWKRLRPTRPDRIVLLAIASGAPLLHIAMDSLNNYGVHPFWPFYDGWLYGDSVFIVEPLLWAAAAPLSFLLQTRLSRCLVLAALAGGVALVFFSGLVPIPLAAAFALLAASMLAAGRLTPPRTALTLALVVWLGVTTMFAAASQVAAGRTKTLAAQHFPEAILDDHVLTPMPVNPLCWDIILIQSSGDALALRRGTFSLAPRRLPANECPTPSARATITAPLEPVQRPDNQEIRWSGELVSSRSQLSALFASDCRVAAFLRFARAPWLASVEGKLVLGDLRFDNEVSLGFAEIDLRANPASCPRHVPLWAPPREHFLFR
jgi:inner membrane protein